VKVKVKNWTYLVKDRNTWYEDKNPESVIVSEEEEEEGVMWPFLISHIVVFYLFHHLQNQ
jgi:hypothetical protein